METEILAAIIASLASLAGVGLGGLLSWLSDRGNRAEKRRERRERISDEVADDLQSALLLLRAIPEEDFNDQTREDFLPRTWYETAQPPLLRHIGDVDDGEIRRALRDVVTSLGDTSTHSDRKRTYHYVESQLLLALDIASAYKRGDRVDDVTASAIRALRDRMTSPF